MANQFHGFTIDYGKFILRFDRNTAHVFYFSITAYGGELMKPYKAVIEDPS